jgi:uncharacterized membrane protein YraQ (UPF0718 family)
MSADKQPGRIDWPDLLRESFGQSFWFFVAFAAGMAGICYLVLGPDAFAAAVARDRELLADLVPRVAAAQIVAGMIWVLLPRNKMSEFLRRNQGRRGLIIATAAGAITPGGPSSAFPFLLILAGSGADKGILVAYITSWALLGVQRIIVWDIPLMGIDFSLLRFLIGLPLPIIAGMLARRLPLTVAFEESAPPEGLGR